MVIGIKCEVTPLDISPAVSPLNSKAYLSFLETKQTKKIRSHTIRQSEARLHREASHRGRSGAPAACCYT